MKAQVHLSSIQEWIFHILLILQVSFIIIFLVLLFIIWLAIFFPPFFNLIYFLRLEMFLAILLSCNWNFLTILDIFRYFCSILIFSYLSFHTRNLFFFLIFFNFFTIILRLFLHSLHFPPKFFILIPHFIKNLIINLMLVIVLLAIIE